MEQLRAELSHLLGEKLSRVECVSEQAATALWFLYDAQGNPMPLLARSFTTPGVARQLAWKISTLARNGTVRMPVVYGVMTHEEHPGPDVLLLERLRSRIFLIRVAERALNGRLALFDHAEYRLEQKDTQQDKQDQQIDNSPEDIWIYM